MTKNPRFRPTVSVGIIVPEYGQLIGLVGMLEVFDAANRVLATRGRAPLFEASFLGLSPTTQTASGVRVQTQPMDTLDTLPQMLVVGGGLDPRDPAGTTALPFDPALLRAIDSLRPQAKWVVSVCTGAFALARLGLLDGRRCTTHWLTTDTLAATFPEAKVEPDALYTEDQGLFTSAGATAGIDLALHLVRALGNAKLALAVARTMVVFAHRPGGQAQFSSALRLRATDNDAISTLIGTIVADPAAAHRVPDLARRCAMSPRNFTRVFRTQTGQSPAAFVATVRVEAAQQMLAHTHDGIEQIADAVGFTNPETMRRTFLRVAGVSPAAFRKGMGAHA